MNFHFKISFVLALSLCFFSLDGTFIFNKEQLRTIYNRNDVVMVASTGRSGSTVLFEAVNNHRDFYTVFKIHRLPPSKKYTGKILFIFSNPDKAAESALHLMISDPNFGNTHFNNMQTSNKKWLRRIGDSTKQNLTYNLLNYDALGIAKHLYAWLHKKTIPGSIDSQILAIKYENLWDPETQLAIKNFLKINHFSLPPYRERGYNPSQLSIKEKYIRHHFNLGDDKNPRYKAYDNARKLWEEAPPIQYLDLK